jgi:hypothetical protein
MLLALCSGACGGLAEPVDPYHCAGDYCVGGDATVGYVAVFAPTSVDVLIVLDDAVPSGPDAPALAQGLRAMTANLSDFMASGQWGADLNVAIVPAAAGPAGSPLLLWPASPSCPQPNGPFLHVTQVCGLPNNFSGNVPDAVACAATHLEPSGEAARPIDAIHAALEPGVGFRRAGAYLFVIIVSAQDAPGLLDAAQVAEQHDFLAGLVPDPETNLMVGIVAPAAAEGLAALARSFGDYATSSDIAASTWPALPSTTEYFGWHESWPACLDWDIVDADPATDGLQPDCAGTEIHLSSTSPSSRTEQPLPPCPNDGTVAGACWRVIRDTNKCPANGLEFVVEGWRPACMPSYAVKYTLTCAVRYD